MVFLVLILSLELMLPVNAIYHTSADLFSSQFLAMVYFIDPTHLHYLKVFCNIVCKSTTVSMQLQISGSH